jgi:hypothetical protein
MRVDRYRLSFTSGGLFLQQAPIVAECYLLLRDWSKTSNQVRVENLLQARTAASALRTSKEIISRLEHLDLNELEALVNGGLRDQGYILWSAVCRRYAFLHDFSIEVLREHYLLLRRQLAFGDYDTFYNTKALWHKELDEITLSTQYKLRQNLFLMLKQADLISDQLYIQTAMLSPQVAQILSQRGRDELLIFPATDNEIKRWLI